MARIRTIKPEFWKNEKLSDLPEATHLLAASLLNYVDDEGYFNAHPKLVAAECCPLREPSVSIRDSLIQLSDIGYLRLGTGEDGKRYGHIVNFSQHQKINRPSPSKIKELHILWERSPHFHGALSEESRTEVEVEREVEKEQTLSAGADGVAELQRRIEVTLPPAVEPPQTGSHANGADEADDIPAILDRRAYPPDFEDLWQCYRETIGAPNASKAEAAKAHRRLTEPEKNACQAGLAKYCMWVGEQRQKRPDFPAKHLATFIHQRGWEPFLEMAA